MQQKKRSSIARHILSFAVLLIISLVLGRISEFMIDDPALEEFKAYQGKLAQTVGALAPWNIADAYVKELGGAVGITNTDTEDPQGVRPDAKPAEPPRSGPAILLAPLGALLAVFARLVLAPGGFATIFALLQFAAGFGLVLWLFANDRRSTWFWLLGVPLGTIALGGCVGWLTQMFMLAGIGLFGWL